MSGKKALLLGGAPRVSLLPPEAAQREKARGARRLSILLLVLVIVLVGAGYGYAFSLNSTASFTGPLSAGSGMLLSITLPFGSASPSSAPWSQTRR